MLELIKKEWAKWMMSAVIALLTVILTSRFAVKRDTDKSIKDELKTKASIEYVDNQDAELKSYVDTRADNNRDNLDRAIDAQTKIIESMDHKLDILINER